MFGSSQRIIIKMRPKCAVEQNSNCSTLWLSTAWVWRSFVTIFINWISFSLSQTYFLHIFRMYCASPRRWWRNASLCVTYFNDFDRRQKWVKESEKQHRNLHIKISCKCENEKSHIFNENGKHKNIFIYPLIKHFFLFRFFLFSDTWKKSSFCDELKSKTYTAAKCADIRKLGWFFRCECESF